VPDGIIIKQSSLPHVQLGVFSHDRWISEGTEMGPFTGRYVSKNEINESTRNEFMWEVLNQNGELSHFIDGSGGNTTNWMCFVNCARNASEQNLILHQHSDGTLYYKAIKDIPPDHELLIWYGPEYAQFLGIPDVQQFGNCMHNVQKNNQEMPIGRMKCTICFRGFNSRSNLRSHMRIHTAEKPFQCKYCRKCFSQSSTLRNHVRLHTGEKPYKCNVCNCAYSQLAGLRAHQKSARHRP
ncbi:uncharacterized protein TRIADDRAFT_14897, partial [Trichoplax adhaerens]